MPSLLSLVEHRGFEPLASTLPVLRAPNCANAPYMIDNSIILAGGVFVKGFFLFLEIDKNTFKATETVL